MGNGPLRELLAVLADGLFCADSPLFEPTPDGTAWHVRARIDPAYAAQANQYVQKSIVVITCVLITFHFYDDVRICHHQHSSSFIIIHHHSLC